MNICTDFATRQLFQMFSMIACMTFVLLAGLLLFVSRSRDTRTEQRQEIPFPSLSVTVVG